MALPDNGPVTAGPTFPGSPYLGQFWTLTATDGGSTPDNYIYNLNGGDTGSWNKFTADSVAPPGSPS